MRRVILSLAALLLGGVGQASADLIQNGGFETGDLTGWTINTSGTGVAKNGGPGGYAPHSGTYYAFLGTMGSLGTLSQTITDTAGQKYALSMWIDSNGFTPNEFEVVWDGVVLSDQTKIGNTNGYTQLAFTVQGTGSDTLSLGERDDPSFLALDDVSLTPTGPIVPEPSSLAMLCVASASFAGYFGWRRRRRQRVPA